MLPIRARMPIIHQARLQLALQVCTVLALVMCEVDVEPSKPGQETQQISTNTSWSLGLGLIFLCQGLALWDWPGRKTCLELCRTTCESPRKRASEGSRHNLVAISQITSKQLLHSPMVHRIDDQSAIWTTTASSSSPHSSGRK